MSLFYGNRTTTEEKKSPKSSRKLNFTRFLGQLAAILENPNLKSLQWDETGDAVLVNVKLYEEEIEMLGEFLPELRNFRSISMLHGLLCTFGFKKKVAKLPQHAPDQESLGRACGLRARAAAFGA
ncbi:hypothetical protein NDU88_002011 [Pleurodeles waltl]|uniref:HSF-type DNA-binding domain-containing protein n=1 Tax=Pleurodeles waltl TaxID=8319 RepID=A0AAV7L036_PLEWA|nr:hypothetical protein NDU88_002011 [Pleurodeles waltl]